MSTQQFTAGAPKPEEPSRGRPHQQAPNARLVFLTGATGFIGSRLARRLAERGDRLRCLVRPTSDTADLERLGAELVAFDLTDADAMAEAMREVELAYHAAAIYDIGPAVDSTTIQRTNVDGTHAFVQAVERAGTPRAVYVSTTGALAPVTKAAEPAADEQPVLLDPERAPSRYQRTKVEAHRLARTAIRDGLPLMIACPAFVYGPGDAGPGGRFIADVATGRMPGLLMDPAWFSYVHVDDVVDALVRVGADGALGAEYILSGEPHSVNEFAAEVARLAGRRPPMLRFPVPLARLTGMLLDPISRLTGIRFPISRESVDSASRQRLTHGHERASRELGYSPRSLAEGLPETF